MADVRRRIGLVPAAIILLAARRRAGTIRPAGRRHGIFLGDSITAARTYGKIVESYTLLRFPARGCE